MSKVDAIIFCQRFILETKFRHKKYSARRVLSEYVSNMKLKQRKVDGPICGLIRPPSLSTSLNDQFFYIEKEDEDEYESVSDTGQVFCDPTRPEVKFFSADPTRPKLSINGPDSTRPEVNDNFWTIKASFFKN
jgi:hypothetical protein